MRCVEEPAASNIQQVAAAVVGEQSIDGRLSSGEGGVFFSFRKLTTCDHLVQLFYKSNEHGQVLQTGIT